MTGGLAIRSRCGWSGCPLPWEPGMVVVDEGGRHAHETPVVDPTEIVEERDGEWRRVEVVEEKPGFTVVDRRSVR